MTVNDETNQNHTARRCQIQTLTKRQPAGSTLDAQSGKQEGF